MVEVFDSNNASVFFLCQILDSEKNYSEGESKLKYEIWAQPLL